MINPKSKKATPNTGNNNNYQNAEQIIDDAYDNPNEQSQDQPLKRRTSLSSFVQSPLSAGNSSQRTIEVLEAMKERIVQMREQNKIEMNISIFAPNIHNVKFDSIVAYHIHGDESGQQKIAYAVLMIETDKALRPKEPTSNTGKMLELPTVTYETFNAYYEGSIKEAILKDAKTPALQMLFGGVGVLAKELDIKATANIDAVLTALSNQAVSPIVESSIQANTTGETFADIVREGNYRLDADLKYSPQVFDVNGLPQATDLTITTTAYGDQGDSVQGDEVVNLAHVGIIMDLQYSIRDVQIPNPNGFGPAKNHRYSYIATQVITGVEQNGLLTLDRLLLAISTVMIAHDSRIWVELLRPKPVNQNYHGIKPLGSFAAVGYDLEDEDGNYMALPVNSEEYTKDNYARLYAEIEGSVFPELATAIDIPESILGARPIKTLELTGLTTNQTHHKTIQAAKYKVISTLDRMTNNAFSDIFNATSDILEPQPIMIALGYWIDEEGNRRDLREFGYLAAREYSANTPDDEFIKEWENTFIPVKEGLEATSCAERLQLIKKMARGEVVVKGYAYRYRISAQFLVAAAMATVEAGIAPTYNNLTEQSIKPLRGSSTHLEASLVSRDNVDIYTRKTVYARSVNNVQRPTFERNNGGQRY